MRSGDGGGERPPGLWHLGAGLLRELGLARGGRGRRELWRCPVQAWSSGLLPIGFIVALKGKLPF
jgi:hypothetical protein